MENLAKALAEFQKALPKVTKDNTASIPTKTGGNYQYTYTDLATLTHTVVPLLVQHGLSFVSYPRFGVEGGGYELVGRLMHISGEFLEGSLPLYGRQPQEIGSAITYARRYLLGAMTGVVTEDDDDGARTVQSERMPAKDWDAVADTAESLTTLAEVQALWQAEDVGRAPKVIQDRVKAAGDALRAADDSA